MLCSIYPLYYLTLGPKNNNNKVIFDVFTASLQQSCGSKWVLPGSGFDLRVKKPDLDPTFE